MLYAINGGRVAGCSLRQSDIIYFETIVENIYPTNNTLVFYDRNATLAYSVAHTDLKKLKTEIAWDLLTEEPTLDGFCQYFQNIPSDIRYAQRMEYRQAEFLPKIMCIWTV